MANEDVVVKIAADVSSLTAAMQSATAAMQASAQQMTASVQGLQPALDDIQSKFEKMFTIAGAVAAIETIKHVADAMDALAVASIRVGQTAGILGISRQELEGLHGAADAAGVGADRLDGALEMLELRMQTARDTAGPMRDKFATVGITLADLRDKSFTATSAAYALAASHATHGEKMDVVGRRGIALMEVLGSLGGGQEAARKKAEELGATTAQEALQLAQYHKAVSDLTLQWGYFKTRLVADVAPALTALITSFASLFDLAHSGEGVLDGLAAATRAIAKDFFQFASEVRVLWLDTKQFFEVLGDSIGNLGAVLVAADAGHFKEAAQIYRDGVATQKAIEHAHDEAVLQARTAMWAGIRAIDASQLQEVAVSASLLELGQAKAKDPKPPKTTGERVKLDSFTDVDKEIAADQRVLEMIGQEREVARLGDISSQEKMLSEELRANDTSASEYLKRENKLIDDRLAVQKQYYQTKWQLADGDIVKETEAELAISRAQAEALKQRAAAALTADKAMDALRTKQEQMWHSFGDQIASTMSGSLNSILNGQKTFSAEMKSLFANMVESIIASLIRVRIEQVINAMIAKTTTETSAKSGIMAHAAEAASAAAASAAQIPLVGWILAPAAAAAVYAAALAFPMAEQGANLGAFSAPIMQLHPGEMVLPRDLSNTIRGMSGSDGAGSGSGGGGDTHNINLNVSAIDGASVEQWFSSPRTRAMLTAAIKTHYDRGGRPR